VVAAPVWTCASTSGRVLVDAIGVRVHGEPPRAPAQEAIEDREHVGVGRDGRSSNRRPWASSMKTPSGTDEVVVVGQSLGRAAANSG
jgi:hypothetical protein